MSLFPHRSGSQRGFANQASSGRKRLFAQKLVTFAIVVMLLALLTWMFPGLATATRVSASRAIKAVGNAIGARLTTTPASLPAVMQANGPACANFINRT